MFFMAGATGDFISHYFLTYGWKIKDQHI